MFEEKNRHIEQCCRCFVFSNLIVNGINADDAQNIYTITDDHIHFM